MIPKSRTIWLISRSSTLCAISMSLGIGLFKSNFPFNVPNLNSLHMYRWWRWWARRKQAEILPSTILHPFQNNSRSLIVLLFKSPQNSRIEHTNIICTTISNFPIYSYNISHCFFLLLLCIVSIWYSTTLYPSFNALIPSSIPTLIPGFVHSVQFFRISFLLNVQIHTVWCSAVVVYSSGCRFGNARHALDLIQYPSFETCS